MTVVRTPNASACAESMTMNLSADSAGRMPSLEVGLKRLNYYLIENLETGKDLRMIRWVHNSRESLVLFLRLKGTPSMINEVTDMLHRAPLTTPTTLPEKAVHDISRALTVLLSDVFALYLKT